MRLLLADPPVAAASPLGSDLDLDALAQLYAVPSLQAGWLRVNMVSTLDGAAVGADGLTGSINNEADQVVFDLVRAVSDVLVIGAGTARAEGYTPVRLDGELARVRADAGRPPQLPLVLVTASGAIPPALRMPDPAAPVFAVTCAESPGLAGLRGDLGPGQVIVAGRDTVDLAEALGLLRARGWHQVHSEGGPHLLGELLAADLVDELDLTFSPMAVAGPQQRITVSQPLQRRFRATVLVEQDGTVMGRWLRHRNDRPAG